MNAVIGMILLNYIDIVATPDQKPYLIICSRRAKVKLGGLVDSHYRPIINYQLDRKREEAIILYIHMHFITYKFHLYHSDYILQEL